MREIAAKLRAHLAEEERQLRTASPRDGRFALLELARAMDLHFLAGKRDPNSVDELLPLTQLYEFGWPRALSIFVDESVSIDGPAPLFPSDANSTIWAHAAIQHCGRIALVEHLLDSMRYGLMSLEQRGDSEFAFRYGNGPRGLEELDWSDFMWATAMTAKSEAAAAQELHLLEPEMRAHLARLVYRFRDHYIGYDAVPELDDFFQAKGILAARQCLGQDSFHGDTLFGGNPFNLYRGAVGILIGWTLKHRAFCEVLLEKYPDLLVPNILTIHAPLQSLEECLAAQLDVDADQARMALEIVTLKWENRTSHTKAGSFPSLIAVGRRHAIESVSGILGQPFFFMLRELRRRYPADWDRAVDQRETLFRTELNQVFGAFGISCLRREKNIQIDNRTATDVDAAFADLRNGVLGIFQLKWQDRFGRSMRERESRKKNLLDGGNRWVVTMKEWLRDRSAEQAGQALGLPSEAASRLKSVRLFVLGRTFVNFSGPTVREPGAAWGNWAQLGRVMVEGARDFVQNPLEYLFQRFMQQRSASSEESANAQRMELPLSQIRVVLET